MEPEGTSCHLLDGGKPVTVPAVFAWKTNGDLIADVARLGYLDGLVLDPTYGRGKWWTKYRPRLVYSDVNPHDADVATDDFTALHWPDEYFDAVAFDPPYKLNGTPGGDVDDRYGVGEPTRWQDRMFLCRRGAIECARVLKPGGYLLWKCQDQVCAGRVRWQTHDFVDLACQRLDLDLVDRFDMLGTTRPQPAGRQVHAHGRPSTLLVFQKPK